MKRLIISLLLFFSATLAQTTVYVLCEGNFNNLNASLWSIAEDNSEIDGPIYWNFSTNPLGDTGQNLKIYDNKLYIVMNNSNTIEIADISNGFQFIKSIDLPYAGPRDIEIIDNTAYISCWYLNGILSIDLDNYTLIDTLELGNMPEDLLYYNGELFASITMNSDWTSSDKILGFNIINRTLVPVDTFTVVTGPEELLGYNDHIYVSSTYYDNNWNTYAGNSKIDLETKNVVTHDFGITMDFGRDITLLNNRIYRIYQNGICALTDSLTMDQSSQIGNYPLLYSMASFNGNIYLGMSDYTAPDNIVIMDSSGTEIRNFQVGAIPGAFAFYESTAMNLAQPAETDYPEIFQMRNYPNPFNSSTTISFQIPSTEHISVTVYNSIGQKVKTLLKTEKTSGRYSVLWDGRNQHGYPVAGGIYYAVAATANSQNSLKILYLK